MLNVKCLIPLLVVGMMVVLGCENQCRPCAMKAGDSSADAPDVVLFERMDENGNGQVTLEEYRMERKKFFVELDQDGNDNLTLSEFRQGMDERFDWHDVNDDGTVTHEEILLFAVGYVPDQINKPPHPKDSNVAAFLRMDVDQDGVLSEKELAGEASLWYEMSDHDGNAVRTKSEFNKQMAVFFARMDKDGDGTVRRQEFMLFFHGE